MIVLFAAGVVALDVGIIVALMALFSRPWRRTVTLWCEKYGILALFLFASISVAATLWMQYDANLAPCIFCWWQRICMYPIVLITFIALIKGARMPDIADYILGLSLLGALIALYQHLLQLLPSGSLIPCDASDDCAIRSVFEFHFVTLPWMAFTVFFAIALIAILARGRR
ncbi:MAG TPA: disulfide bond formation protein B [Candidatus Paceibacterota bacterium]|nr:disulfide bond formation protein B [Candidatus Paceibacterota bacterium]